MIKASYEVLQPASGHSFLFRKFGKSAFDAPYHFHEEVELTYIVRGFGKRYVGNHMEDFASGDLVLLGANLPHCWKLDADNPENQEASAIVIQFNTNFMGDDFFGKAELQGIQKLLAKSGSGMSFNSATRNTVNHKLEHLAAEKNNFRMLVHLLEILQRLAVSNEYNLLDHKGSVAERSKNEQERINPIFAYLVENFRGDISLNEAAGIASMTPNAFCKYFKRITRKTFMETVIEYRLNYATQQLIQTDKPISDISFESGFGDVSHFYKMFKHKMNQSPLNYRKNFMRELDADKNRVPAQFAHNSTP
ncbi:MAG TPA: AraC family transcriptional regulator [Mucilaginibacter sp.]|nr:AraC family transcriptional regulator [Mucilaginibacter sp.]